MSDHRNDAPIPSDNPGAGIRSGGGDAPSKVHVTYGEARPTRLEQAQIDALETQADYVRESEFGLPEKRRIHALMALGQTPHALEGQASITTLNRLVEWLRTGQTP